NLERGLFLVTQIMDMGLPVAMVLNMKDVAATKGIDVNTFKLFKKLNIPVIQTNAREKNGIAAVHQALQENTFNKATFLPEGANLIPTELSEKIQERFNLSNAYQCYQLLRFADHDSILNKDDKDFLKGEL